MRFFTLKSSSGCASLCLEAMAFFCTGLVYILETVPPETIALKLVLGMGVVPVFVRFDTELLFMRFFNVLIIESLYSLAWRFCSLLSFVSILACLLLYSYNEVSLR